MTRLLNPCGCGCGEMVPRQFARGHWGRLPSNKLIRAQSLEKLSRNAQVRAAHREGKSVQEVAEAFGISPQRVGQILEPQKHRAREAANRAVSVRKIPWVHVCEHCGGKATDKHHPDYTRPLDVLWLCRACHHREHRRIRAESQNRQKEAQ